MTFDFNGVNFRTVNYDISIAQSSRDNFVNSDEYSFESDFILCDYSLIVILADGSESHCSGAGDMINYGFFDGSSIIHHTVTLPENTVAIRFEGNALQSYSGVRLIIANAQLSTLLME